MKWEIQANGIDGFCKYTIIKIINWNRFEKKDKKFRINYITDLKMQSRKTTIIDNKKLDECNIL